MLSRAALFNASECTVRLSGFNAFTCSKVSLTSSRLSSGSPMIRSMLISSNPSSLARWKLSTVCATVCLRPMIFNVSSFIVCGLMEILVMSHFFNVSNFSLVMLSGRPASTVNSRQCDRSKLHRILRISRSSWYGSSVVGVPPPM